MFFFKKKTSRKDMMESRRKRQLHQNENALRIRVFKFVWYSALFVMFSFFIAGLCFYGQSPAGPLVQPAQIAKFRIIAETPFTYKSKILTDRIKDQRRRLIAPVFRLNTESYYHFKTKINDFLTQLNQLDDKLHKSKELNTQNEIQNLIDKLNIEHTLDLRAEDIKALLAKSTPDSRTHIFDELLFFLKDISLSGIMDTGQAQLNYDPNRPNFFSIEILDHPTESKALSREDALLALRRYIRVLDVDPETNRALFRIFQAGIIPNLTYDDQATNQKVQQILDQVQPITVNVKTGQVIIEPGSPITDEQYEQLSAYRLAIKKQSVDQWDFGINFQENWFLTIGILGFALLYCLVAFKDVFQNPKHFLFIATIITLNLFIIRIITQIANTEYFIAHPSLVFLLPYFMPVFLAPILAAVLVGPALATLCALLIGFFDALMLGNNVETLLIASIGSLVCIVFCYNIRRRGKILRAGIIAATLTGFCAIIVGLFDGITFPILGVEFAVALANGILTSIITIGLIPLFEYFFKYTTNITLLELADFNNPILRKLQIVAPGTYHHSLMISNLAEKAAIEIGANGLICRTCALYHDIGKMTKPEYYTENQNEIDNPHQDVNPSMSALVIKSHITEGIEMARQAKLPPIIMDAIQQHHGTMLIRYFYTKAQQKSAEGKPDLEIHVEENTFRYDGPKPQTKEMAILMLADAVEAASRSLRKVTTHSVMELIETLVNDRVDDKQLDDSPLTFKDLATIKTSFYFTVLTMLHTRIEYQKSKEESKSQ
jgi:putative nucleotidyltransferase with HDIG domain